MSTYTAPFRLPLPIFLSMLQPCVSTWMVPVSSSSSLFLTLNQDSRAISDVPLPSCDQNIRLSFVWGVYERCNGLCNSILLSFIDSQLIYILELNQLSDGRCCVLMSITCTPWRYVDEPAKFSTVMLTNMDLPTSF